MSLFSIQGRKHTTYYDHLMSSASSKTPARERMIKEQKTTQLSTHLSTDSVNSTCGESRSVYKSINRTYVIPGLSKSGGPPTPAGTPTPTLGRLTLQRRKTNTNNTENNAEQTTAMSDPAEKTHTPAPEKRLTLQRRTRTVVIDRSVSSDSSRAADGQRLVPTGEPRATKVLSESNSRVPGMMGVLRTASLRDTVSKFKVKEHSAPAATPVKITDAPGKTSHNKTPTPATRQLGELGKAEDHAKVFSTPTKRTPFERIASKKDVFEKLSVKEPIPRAVSVKNSSLERPKMRRPQAEETKPVPTPRGLKTSSSVFKSNASLPARKTSSDEAASVQGNSTPSEVPPATSVSAEPLVRPSELPKPQDSLKMENSAVTVAVRVRPFNAREKAENRLQVIFMKDQETVVQHPVSKHSHSFVYDFSFCSVDVEDPSFASQQTVYQTLARPLLERAFEGFNTCLFAYGQTGSGKSYTMMGFGEEAGVIPRFCQELFSRLASVQKDKVSCHLEMSYFEVYNEKIHDLLVARDNQNHRLPLRVREHPVHGPYVADLSTHVVSSFSDIQVWLELGNKQRATAATGMNDKSSRSHSVFTLVMTQTKTEFVEEEEHDHRITSRINLVDLAGSERCNSAQTSGERLREGASINMSLLTLGKVISALADQVVNRKRVFIPYRESVLTWLLKESLGGNSKTAMIATVSPAGSNVDESLSTLRYAQQARTIINLAKVNEDTNAKLIRELKLEVEKLRAAQTSAQGVLPERERLFQQEIAGLRSKLTQRERENLENQRAWREKLEQAEIRKREETKELQRAGLTFKVDNRLPNLVNLNEDPQLSEMLLYMIREGRTLVGKLKSESPHDIQLSGALIGDRHCVISNVGGTVSVTPMESAKTFVNGNLIFTATVLNHGDRVILGGDHYFRFNHPAEVQSGKRVSCWTGSGDGQKDFEFAKNELLSAQRAQLEAEIEEAHLKAKQEMMQGIQMAKELAQKELSDQRARYEDRIHTLEEELVEESQRKQNQEQDNRRVANQMAELRQAKQHLELEVDTQKKRLRLHVEAQALEEHSVRQAKIVDALEAEKVKLSRDLEEIQKRMALRENRTPKTVAPQWDAMKLSLMIEEANKISTKLRKNTRFSRHESSEMENAREENGMQVRVQNTKLGISTFWTLERFQNNMAAMRELEQGEAASKDDEVFYDPDDEWEQDLSASSSTTTSSSASFSRRRSRSLLKSRRISGRLYEIRVHPIQSLLGASSTSTGLMGVAQPPSTHPSASSSALPGICKELIGQSLSTLRGCGGPEESMADRLIHDLQLVYTVVRTVCDLYDGLDDDSQENVFACRPEAQGQLVVATSAVERAVFLTRHWLASTRPAARALYSAAEELRCQVKRMGGFLQLLIQGCESEISSMVTEAHRKSSQCLDVALRSVGHLAALTGEPLGAPEPGARAIGKSSTSMCLLEGTNKGVGSLLEAGLHITKEMLRDAQLAYPRTPALQSLKSKAVDLACSLQTYIHCHMTERESGPDRVDDEDEAQVSRLQKLRAVATMLFQLNRAIAVLHTCLTDTLRGKGRESNLTTGSAAISSSARAVGDLVRGHSEAVASVDPDLPCPRRLSTTREELQAAIHTLTTTNSDQQGAEGRQSAGPNSTGSYHTGNDDSDVSKDGSFKNKAAAKVLSSLASDVSSNRSPHWV
ncbi:kinesin-like protein KIF14 [Gadus macrocephalus]|uniref:kinesin-like protein KIF14 n=1 Tax=Gadus macrocephalus TaxID=80720 RepID=UPI0028CB9139|nr:kinesin-like protein KIF14 [Gadus macrocephalus]